MISKITGEHRTKLAYVYLRQSTMGQVRFHQESTQRQYALRDKALEMGWPPSQVKVLDGDLGLSGAHTNKREDFKLLVAEVSMQRVGAVLALEASRLSRSCADWHRLLELCALTGTLIVDEDGTYDPAQFNDQLLLGLKGTMSQAELHFLRARLLGGKRNKAKRGELRFPLPVGFSYDSEGHTVQDPDEEIRGAIGLFFKCFAETGSAYAVVHRLSPKQILARKSDTMAEKLRLFMVREPDKKVFKLRELARSVLPPPAALCATLQVNLKHEVSVYEHISGCIHGVNKAIAHHLAPTPGAMLTSVPGIGITLAAALYAEIGDPNRAQCLRRMSSYAGLVARLKQTGGPDKEAWTQGRSRRACVPLKRCIMDIALKVGQYGHDELKADYFMRSPDLLSEEEIRKYFVHLTCERKLARPTVTIALCGIKFFYEKTLKRDWSLTGVPTPKREKKVPVVMTHEQVKAILACVRTVRHRACLSLIYACGLRLGEACRVKVTDIDRVRGLLRVGGKGFKQRYVPLPEPILPLLEACWRSHRNPVWLFPLVGRGGRLAQISDRHVPLSTVQQAFRKAYQESGVTKKVSVHSLRHAYATHLLEVGVSLRQIQEWLGHCSPSTTSIYAHLTAQSVQVSAQAVTRLMADVATPV